MYGVKRVSETMTTTHEQIRITKHGRHYGAALLVGERFITAEGDTKVSAHLSLFDCLVADGDPAIVISPDIAELHFFKIATTLASDQGQHQHTAHPWRLVHH